MSINLYPAIILEHDLTPTGDSFDAECDEIHAACKGWGTDEKKLNIALGSKSASERYSVIQRYPEIYEKSVYDLVKSETSGDYKLLLSFLSLPLDEAEAKMIRNATKGLGTNEKSLIPIVCGRSNADIEALKKSYFRKYGKDLAVVMKSELGGDLYKLVNTCMQGIEETFDPEYHTSDKAQEDADEFYECGQGKVGTDESAIFKLLCTSPPRHLQAVNAAYVDQYGYALFKAFEKELGGDAEVGAVFTLGMKLKPFETVAHLIKNTCAGMGTDEVGLSSCIVRYQMMLNRVGEAHERLFDKTLLARVKSETKGDYEHLLTTIIENVSSESLNAQWTKSVID